MTKGPTLTDAKGMGGVIAQGGFDYQLWDAVVRVPGWLRNPTFEGFILEGLEDFEARFFSPHASVPYFLDRFQAKAGVLSAAEVAGVFASFKQFDDASPRVARVQTLVTPRLPGRLEWVARDPDRVARARPFYRPFPDALAATDLKLEADLVAEFGPEVGPFVGSGVEIALRAYEDRNAAEVAFAAALQKAWPETEATFARATRAFDALTELATKSRGTMLARRALLDVLVAHLGTSITPGTALRLHVRSNVGPDIPDAVELDATPFSGSAGVYPDPAIWRAGLVDPLVRTAQWSRGHGYSRISLGGTYRISTALAAGWAFRSAAGFEIEIPTKTGAWPTDTHPTPGTHPPWTLSAPAGLVGQRLILGVGVLRDPGQEIIRQVAGASHSTLLLATLPQALTSALDAQASAQLIKTAVAREVARHRPAAIDLFYVGPAAFAVALGHRWNGLPPTQLWEFLPAQGRYTPSALLS